MMSELARTETAMMLANLPAEVLTAIQHMDAAASSLSNPQSGGVFGRAFESAMAMGAIHHSLTNDLMGNFVMPLQGKSFGFRTDKDRNGGYPVAIVRNCLISHVAKGGRLVENELNIIAGNDYQTKSFFFRRLDDILGAGMWFLVHQPPAILKGPDPKNKTKQQVTIGARVTTMVRWVVDGETMEEELIHSIKGDPYSSVDQFLGKADRKCGNWLYRRVTGLVLSDGDADDVIEVAGTDVTDAPATPAKRKRRAPAKPKVEKTEGEGKKAEPEAAPAPKKDKPKPPAPTPESESEPVEGPPSLIKVLQAGKVNLAHASDFCRARGYLKGATSNLTDLSDEMKGKILGNVPDFVKAIDAWRTEQGK